MTDHSAARGHSLPPHSSSVLGHPISAPSRSVAQAPRSRRPAKLVIVVAALVAGVVLTGTGAQGAVSLGTAESFAVLANTTITNTGATTISGDVGLYPGTSVTGFGTVTLAGTLHVTDAVAQQAEIDATTTYGVLQSRTPCTDLSGQVLGQDVGTAATPLLPGVYCFSSSAQLTGDLYLSGGGEYIFKTGSTLTTASGSQVILLGGAQACNIFWAIGSSATFGTNSRFVGTVIANVSITANTGAVFAGRLFALTGAVTLQSNTITRPVCLAPTTTTTTTVPTSTSTSTSTTVPPSSTTSSSSTTVAPTTTSSTSTTVAPTTSTISPTTTVAPTTTTISPTTTVAPTTTTISPTTTVAPTTSTTAVFSTSTAVTSASTTSSSTSSTLVVTTSTSTTVPATTTATTSTSTSTSTTMPVIEIASVTGASVVAVGDTTSGTQDQALALARTGLSVRWWQFWGGVALALGGVLVRLGTAPGDPACRRPGDTV